MESQGIEKDRLTKKVEAESVAYCVCSAFELDTSEYSFPYIAGWSSGKEMRELKASMNVIRKTAGEMIKLTEKIEMMLEQKQEKLLAAVNLLILVLQKKKAIPKYIPGVYSRRHS